MRGVGRAYLPVLRSPGAKRLALGGLVGRLREGGISLAIILGVRGTTGSFGTAGITAAVFFGCAAVARPLQGRWMDRVGARPVLMTMTCANAIALGMFAAGVADRVAGWLLAAVAGVAGATLPALSASLRAMWPTIAPTHREIAYALDTLLYELSLIVSPSIVALLATLVSPAIAVLALAASGTAGTVLVALAPSARSRQSSSRPVLRRRVLTRVFCVLALITLCIGFAEGSLTVLIPAFATNQHATSSSGLLLSSLSAGSLIGGLAYGPLVSRANTTTRLMTTTAALTAGLVLLALVGRSPLVFGGILAIVGLALSPTLTTVFVAVQQRVQPDALTEAFGWTSLAAPAGVAAAQALAGTLVSHPGLSAARWQPSVAAAGALALSALLMSLNRPSNGSQTP